MTQTEGSWTLGPGRASPSVQSPSESCPAGVWLNETYELSGVCLKRVAVLIAVMIWRVTQSSAKLRKDVSLSERKSRTALYRPIMPSWTRSSPSPPARKYELAFSRTKPAYLRMSASSASVLPFRALRTSWRSSSSRCTLWADFAAAVAVRAAILDTPGSTAGLGGVPWLGAPLSRKPHLELEGEASTILRSLQDPCENCRMLRTYVRPGWCG